MATKFFALVIGAGPGTGRAAAIRFSKAYPVVLLARKAESYQEAVEEISQAGGKAIGVNADAADEQSISAAFETIKKELPDHKLAVAVYNVGGGALSLLPFLELQTGDWDDSLTRNARGLFVFAQKAIPLLLESVADSPHPPTLLVTGASASIRGSVRWAAAAAGMNARRALSQSLAREFGPQGVHVVHSIIDGVIDIPRNKGFVMNNGVEDGKLSPDAIADTYWHLHTQHRSAFTHELDLRPFVEKF